MGWISNKLKHVSIKPSAQPYVKRSASKTENNLNAKRREVSNKMQQSDIVFKTDPGHAVNTLISEINQIYQQAQEDSYTVTMDIFENAKLNTEAIIQKTVSHSWLVNCSCAGHCDISSEVNKMTLSDMESGCDGRLVPDSTDQTSQESKNDQSDIEDNLEAVIKDNLDRYEFYISDCVKVTDLIAFFGLLSSAQTKELRCIFKRNPVEASKKALEIMKMMTNKPNKYRLLLEALTDAGYPKVVQILDGTLIPVGSCHRDIIRQCAKHIFQRLNTSEILPYFYSKGVISTDDKQQVLQTEKTVSTGIAVLELLDILPNRHIRWFKYFVESLVESGHEDIANIIEDNTNNDTFEKSGNNLERNSTEHTETHKEETLPPMIPKQREPSSKLSSGGRKIKKRQDINGAIYLQKISSIRDSPSPVSELSSDTSCVQASQLNNDIDYSDTIKDNTKNHKDEALPPQIPKPRETSGKSSSSGGKTIKSNDARVIKQYPDINGAIDLQRKSFLRDRGPSPVSESSGDTSCVQVPQMNMDHSDRTKDNTKNHKEEKLPTQMPKPRETPGKTSSGDRNTIKDNDASVVKKCHDINEAIDNQKRLSLWDRGLSPVSESTGDTSCVQVPRLENDLDHSDITKSSTDKIEQSRKYQIGSCKHTQHGTLQCVLEGCEESILCFHETDGNGNLSNGGRVQAHNISNWGSKVKARSIHFSPIYVENSVDSTE